MRADSGPLRSVICRARMARERISAADPATDASPRTSATAASGPDRDRLRGGESAPDPHVAGEEHVAIAERAHGDVRDRPRADPGYGEEPARASRVRIWSSRAPRPRPAGRPPRAPPRASGNGNADGIASASILGSPPSFPATIRPSTVRAPATDTCCPTIARTASSKPSIAPGTRSPGAPAPAARAADRPRAPPRSRTGRRPRRTGGPPARAPRPRVGRVVQIQLHPHAGRLGSHRDAPAAVLQGDTATIGTALDLLHPRHRPRPQEAQHDPPSNGSAAGIHAVDTPIGTLLLERNADGLSGVRFGGGATPPPRPTRCSSTRPTSCAPTSPASCASSTSRWPRAAPSSSARSGPPCSAIPYGEHRGLLGDRRRDRTPGACRAVGAANGRNPLPVIVPCHRVIGAAGSLTGYGGGLDRKRSLLDLERAAG